MDDRNLDNNYEEVIGRFIAYAYACYVFTHKTI